MTALREADGGGFIGAEELGLIRGRCDNATLGPWLVDASNPQRVEASYEHPHSFSGVYFSHAEDAAFAAHARSDIPRLLDALDHAQRECSVQYVKGWNDGEADAERLRQRAEKAEADLAALRDVGIPCELFCPECGYQHVDAPELESGWTNPPHRTHQCHYCGHLWRPYPVATFGILSEVRFTPHPLVKENAALRAERDKLMRAGVRYLNAPYSGEASADPEYGAARNEMRLALGFDAGNPERNHYDWYWPSYIPRPLTAEWLTEIREAMVSARTDPFCDDAAQIMLVLIDSLIALDSEKWTLVDERNDLYRRMQEQAHRAEIAEGQTTLMIDETGPVFEAWQDTVGIEGVGLVELRMAFDALKYGYTVGWERGHADAESENAALRARVEALEGALNSLKTDVREFLGYGDMRDYRAMPSLERIDKALAGGTAEKEAVNE